MEIERLIEAGLTRNQVEVYLELIKHPGQTGGEIAKKISIDRSFAYGIINSLLVKGLVNYSVKENKRLFYPSDPENLLKEIEEKRSKIMNVIKDIKLMKQKTKEELSVQVYEGKSGLKAYIRELLGSSEFDTLGGGGKLNILDLLKYEYPHYLKELNKKKISGRLITSPKNKNVMKRIYKNSKINIKTYDNLKSQINFTIFKDKIAIYSTEEKPFVIIINNLKIADFLRDYFNYLWKFTKK
jgi:sugar-specific transcriptional regulator TrmB